MHGPMGMGNWHMGSGGENQMGIPLIPAPAAFFALMVGVMIGVMIGRRKAMMHDMGCCGDGWSDWAARKKMMGGMPAHHHHGDGMPACGCGAPGAEDRPAQG
jgi:H+/Cl- antiporter ClcA